MGSIVAAREETFRWEVFIWVSLTAISLQILSNLSNDYGDYISGVDNESRLGPQRMTQSGAISENNMKKAIIISALSAFIFGMILIFVSFGGFKLGTLLFLFLGISAIVAAIRYTVGRKPYGYSGFGDVFVFLFFGIAGTAGSYYLHCLNWNWAILLPASTMGFFITGVLNINNIRDYESDKKCQKNTLIVKIGRNAGLWYHFFLILAGWFCFFIFTILQDKNYFLPILSLPFFIRNVWIVFQKKEAKDLNLELRNLSLMTFLFVILNIF